ncbi:T9SS type A sorting domain-containing protein [Edaphocola aurantiacus]|uniref:T9SS type A sorting domain-containing protein n=1 Tax=Edaphocola aurantiacus TaxID=2601682 RepID=UPI001C940CBA|nr:T9SS type A sorting domain-containing protein [Edaphocola aurantiacus]
MRKVLLLSVLALMAVKTNAADYYWVNGGGSWSDLNHWRLGSSSGSIPSIVPSASDNVFFTNQSGFGATVATRTVSLDANGFCNNMSWATDVPNNPVFSRSNTAYTVEVWGNLAIAPAVTFAQGFAFRGSTTNTFTTNGTVNGAFAFDVNKAGGTLNLVDSFVCPSTSAQNNIGLTAGTFNAAGKTIKAYQFVSSNSNTRSFDITGSTLNFTNRWTYTGTNKTLLSTNSFLTVNSILGIDGSTYNKVSCGGLFDGDMVVSNATISKLSFTNVSTGSFATVSNSNNIDTVVFMGRGRIYNLNNIGYLNTLRPASILGNKNVFGTILAQDNFTVSTTDTTTVDSLLLAANKSAKLGGTININNYMRAAGVTCQAFTEVIADTGNIAKLVFGPSASALLNNVLLNNIAAQGNITPIAVSGVDAGGNTGFTITQPGSLTGTTLYWVGGAGDWNDNTHWSYTSGGAGGACIPFIADTVIFNSGSGLASGNIVTTSGNAYCRNISWLSGVGTSTFNQAAGTSFKVYGSALLAPVVTVNATLEFVGSDTASTFTSNGSTLGTLNVTVTKTGSGALTYADNWTNTLGTIALNTGKLSMAGRTIYARAFASSNDNVRNTDITNANIHVINTWAYTGNNNLLQSDGSYLLSDQYINIANRTYPTIDLAYAGAVDVFSIAQSTIGQLTFTSPIATSVAKIYNGNIIRKLEFKGAGNIMGSVNTIDTLLLAGSRNYKFAGTTTINKYLLAQSATCNGLLEMRGNNTGTIQFNPAATISMANVYLQNMAATGVPTVAVTGADAGGNTGWNISSAAGAPRYWIGGSGDWNDNAHWSTTSGGTGGACIPTVYDNVFFDANSGFTGASKTVTINNGNAYSRNLNWANATNAPIWNKSSSWNMEVWGDSIVLNPAATFNASVTAKGSTPVFLKGNVLGDFDFSVDKPGSSLTMLNDFSNAQTNISLYNGTWNASGIKLNVWQVDNSVGVNNVFTVNISNSSVVAPFGWRFQGIIANHTLNAANSSVTTGDFKANGMTYDTVNVTNTLSTSVNMASTTVKSLNFTDPNTASVVGIVGSGNTLGRVEYKGGGIINGSNTIDTLIFFPGNTYTFTAGTNTTINKEWYGSGTPCRLTEILSSSTTANATITKVNGDVTFDYVRLRRITAAGAAAPFVAQQHSTNLGNNTNWNIAAYNGAAPIYGLGPDTALLATAFPYTLHTDGFFGAPSSQYTWNNSSTADSLVITDTGVYSVTVNFVDGCTISDNVHITLAAPLPVTLLSFDAAVANCQTNLNWTIANAVNFNRFVVERSNDGRSYNEIGQIAYTNGKGAYAYTDKATPNGKSFYRLRLVDADGMYAYSQTVTAQSDCSTQAIEVYPTLTKGMVYINLPVGYANAKIELTTIMGQVLNIPVSPNAAQQKINLSGMAQGTYLLKVTSGNETQTFKVVYQP